MYNFFDAFFFDSFGTDKNRSVSDYYKLNKKWGGLNIFYSNLAMVMGRFDYELEDTMDDRSFELCLLADGINGTAKAQDGEINNMKVGAGNKFQKYLYFNNVQLMDMMGRSQGIYIPDLKGNVLADCVLTYDNKYNIPPISRILYHSIRMADIQGSIATTIANMKGSIVFRCNVPEQKNAIKRAWMEADEGAPVIIAPKKGEGEMDLEPEVIANPITGDILKTLQEQYDKTFADFLTEFGINANGVVNKLSGVSGDELHQNDQARRINLLNALKSREEGIEKINKMFGTHCKVKLAEPLEDKLPENLESFNYSEKNTIINSNNDSRRYD